jgi:CRISPR-associated protein (TIGR02710 family)
VAETEKWSYMPGHGLEAVEDLLRNAERRAAQDRYDDAVGRLYRAMELTEQILLKKTADIDTANVDIEKLPEQLKEVYWSKKQSSADGGKLKLALTNAYDLLADLQHPVGLRWRQQRSRIQDCLKTRNHSLFAHGFSPISYGDWKSLSGTLGPFLQQAIDEAIQQAKLSPLGQLPSTIAELLP